METLSVADKLSSKVARSVGDAEDLAIVSGEFVVAVEHVGVLEGGLVTAALDNSSQL